MIPWTQHRERILAAAAPLDAVRRRLDDAEGAVLAEDVLARWPVPLFDNSAMDGYAVRGSEAVEGARLEVVADVPAGSQADPAFGPRQAVRIMTGAPMPSAADAVVPIEQVEAGPAGADGVPAWIKVLAAPRPAAHIRRAGEDTAAGEVSVAAGTVLGPWQLASIASAGYEDVAVHRRPRVAVVSTGSELVAPGATPLRGQIPESNSVLLRHAVRASGAELADVHWLRDDEGSRLSELLDSLHVDAVILTGGASVGAYDVVKETLAPQGIAFDKVAVQPGKPQGFGVRQDGTLVFCLPGNPVAVAVSFELFVRPALRVMLGDPAPLRPVVRRRVERGWRCPPGRAQVMPVVLGPDSLAPAAAGGSGSHLVVSLAAATALAIVPAESERVEPGEMIDVMVLS